MWVQTGAYHLSGLYWLIALIVVFVIALVAIIVAGRALSQGRAAMRARRDNPGQPGMPGAGPEDQKLPESFRMLDERYARGEISREEYMQRQNDLQSKS